MNKSEFTAQEIRKLASCLGKMKALVCNTDFYSIDANGERRIDHVPDYKVTDDIAAMLCYAAGVLDRCEDMIAKLPYPPNSDDVWLSKKLNYILRGGAEEGVEDEGK